MLAFRFVLWLGRHPLVEALGEAEAARVRAEMPARLGEAIRALPDTGKRTGARTFLTATCMLVAFHRCLPGRSAEANTELLRRVCLHAARGLPRLIRRLYRRMFFTPGYHRRLIDSVIGGGPEGFEGAYRPGEGGEFGVDYTRCGIQTFLVRIGQTDLAPHICSFDDLESEIFELGLQRTGTIGRGATRCDFRWRPRANAP